MKLIKICTLILALITVKVSAQNDYAIQEHIYKKSVQYGDLGIAKSALFTMLALKPENTFLKDTLAILYFQSKAYVQSILVTNEILDNDPSKISALEIKAISESALGYVKEALDDYEKLYAKTKNVYHLYQIASLQYQLKRIGECELSINKILADPKVTEQKVAMTIGQRGQQQQVVLKAAAINMKGVLFKETGKLEMAKAEFNEALSIQSDFVLAKGNLQALTKAEEPKEEAVKVEEEQEEPTQSSKNSSKKKKK